MTSPLTNDNVDNCKVNSFKDFTQMELEDVFYHLQALEKYGLLNGDLLSRVRKAILEKENGA